MFGFAFSNWATRLLNVWIAASVLPGIRDTTLIVTCACAEAGFTAAAEIEAAHKASRLVTVTAAIVVIRLDFIVTPFSCAARWFPARIVFDLSIAARARR